MFGRYGAKDIKLIKESCTLRRTEETYRGLGDLDNALPFPSKTGAKSDPLLKNHQWPGGCVIKIHGAPGHAMTECGRVNEGGRVFVKVALSLCNA